MGYSSPGQRRLATNPPPLRQPAIPTRRPETRMLKRMTSPPASRSAPLCCCAVSPRPRSMDCCVATLLCLCAALYLLVQVIRFIFADADLTLLWLATFGKSPEKTLRGKVVWITGASSGIGEELAYQLASLGARLIISARREGELQKVKSRCLELSSLKEGDILILPLDLLERDTHAAKTGVAIQHFGNIDILINNGGRSQRSLFQDTNVDVIQALMDVNYLGTVSVTKHVLPHMIQQGSGTLVAVSSVAGLVGAPLVTGYSASKHALQGFFNSLRTELVEYPGITISTVCPGPVQSHIVHNAFTEELGRQVAVVGEQRYKMATSRCVRLMLVGIASQVKEMWIAQQPFLFLPYLWQYAPTWAWSVTGMLGKRRVENFKAGLDADSSYFTKSKTS